jgi:hypothetical protein
MRDSSARPPLPSWNGPSGCTRPKKGRAAGVHPRGRVAAVRLVVVVWQADTVELVSDAGAAPSSLWRPRTAPLDCGAPAQPVVAEPGWRRPSTQHQPRRACAREGTVFLTRCAPTGEAPTASRRSRGEGTSSSRCRSRRVAGGADGTPRQKRAAKPRGNPSSAERASTRGPQSPPA